MAETFRHKAELYRAGKDSVDVSTVFVKHTQNYLNMP